MRKSYFRIINILALALILVLSIANPVLADGGLHEEVNSVDGYKVKLSFIAGDAQLGRNKLKVEIKDALGRPVGNATVTVNAELYRETSANTANNMGTDMGKDSSGNPIAQQETSINVPFRTAQAEMRAGQKIGDYEGEMILEEPGRWMVQVGFTLLSRKRVAEFPWDVYGTPNSWVILGSFLGINVGIIAVAAITRRKSAITPASEEAR